MGHQFLNSLLKIRMAALCSHIKLSLNHLRDLFDAVDLYMILNHKELSIAPSYHFSALLEWMIYLNHD
jgi:hypothetical protein